MLAVIATGGKQYTVREKQMLRIEKLPVSVRKGEKVTFTQVLLVENDGKVMVGKPVVPKAQVEAAIVQDGKADKIRVVKYKAKTRYKRVRGHRQPFTEVRIEKIVV
ncbi:MAG: 50S ribosomal protein L21 [Candidatus Komeilibacteria bacterium]|nr:50S ribosomal protein L21 [Candidatus Komeilibacteria bacterium]